MAQSLVRFLLASLCILLPAASTRAQTAVTMEGGARAAALGGAATALSRNAWGLANPAAWGTLQGRALSFYATEAFGLSELRLGALRYAEPTPWGTVATGARTFGYESYRETAFLLGYARAFRLSTSRRVHAGLAARYFRLSLGERSDGVSYGSAGALSFSVGALVHVIPRLMLGAAATNVTAASYADGADLPQTLALGLAYRATDRFLVTADAVKDIDAALSVRAGLEVVPVPVLAVRFGASNAPARLTAGIGLRLRRLRARLAAERHRTLGWTPAAGLALQW